MHIDIHWLSQSEDVWDREAWMPILIKILELRIFVEIVMVIELDEVHVDLAYTYIIFEVVTTKYKLFFDSSPSNKNLKI